MWLIGTLDRGAWTPDEPREADIAWRMSVQSHWVLPHLASQPFLEKPPLSYWMSAGSMRLFGPSVRAARAPNLLYAAITALAMGTLGFAMDGVAAAIVAALVASTAITAFRVTMWLAPDACLLAGCAVSLLGAYLGYRLPRAQEALRLSSDACRRGRRLHGEERAGMAGPGAGAAYAHRMGAALVGARDGRSSTPASSCRRSSSAHGYGRCAPAQGAESLRILFWYNLAGRFTHIAAPPHISTARAIATRREVLHRAARLPAAWTALAAVAVWHARQSACACATHGERPGDSPSQPHSPSSCSSRWRRRHATSMRRRRCSA